jgi:hypothetical protein
MGDTNKPNQSRHEDFARRCYAIGNGYDPASVRSGYADAALMCDAIAADIMVAHTVRGRVTKQGMALAESVILAGNVIWNMRKLLPDGSVCEGAQTWKTRNIDDVRVYLNEILAPDGGREGRDVKE